MKDPNRNPNAARRDRTDPIAPRRMSENDTDLDSGPDEEMDEEDRDEDQADGSLKPPRRTM